MNYLSHWGLSDTPFREARDPRYFFAGPAQEEALARLEFLVDHRRPVGLLVGPPGVGKSMLLQVAARRLRRQACQVAVISLVGLNERDLLWELAAQWGLAPSLDVQTPRLWRHIADRLVENRFGQRASVLLADDADQATEEATTMLMRLVNADPSPHARWTTILVSPNHAESRLAPRLVDMAALRIDAEAWELTDTETYVSQALEAAGRSEPIFTESAVERLHELGEGIPRKINRLADLALLAAAAEDSTQIDAEVLEGVGEELLVAS